VNVGGRNRVPMADLRALAAELGLLHPQTLLQSGNLVFGAAADDLPTLSARLSTAIQARMVVETPVILRTLDELAAAVAANAFGEAALGDPGRLHVAFLSGAPRPDDVLALGDLARGGERIAAGGRELFIHYPAGAGDSRLTQSVIDRRLGLVGTARNWNTVTALLAAVRDLAEWF